MTFRRPNGAIKYMSKTLMGTCMLLSLLASTRAAGGQRERWTEQEAASWYDHQPWLVGANYIPSSAINQLEMFQPETFDPQLIDKELELGESIGMNTMRVFLHDQLWTHDPEGFIRRLNQFLQLCAKHHIRPLLVLFDSCWEADPKLGPQHPPIPGVHNSGWVQSPGIKRLLDPSKEGELRAYVKGVIKAFGSDDRVLAWDLWNEPDNQGRDRSEDLELKIKRVEDLLPKVFLWAREVNPEQPLTSGVWTGNWIDSNLESATTKIQLSESDVVSFHNYDWPEEFEKRIRQLMMLRRPLLCTEYMARGNGSTFDTILPLAKKYRVASFNWGFVAGKTQTYLPWDSWQRPYTLSQPAVWFHDIYRGDYTPYRQRELDLIRELTQRGLTKSRDHQSSGILQ